MLRKVSALEYLNMFAGYFNEQTVDVCCSSKGIDYFRDGDVLCCTFEQAVNDIMADWDNADVQALTEALSNYYYQHNKSFEGLNIRPENAAVFDEVKEWAKEYYSNGTNDIDKSIYESEKRFSETGIKYEASEALTDLKNKYFKK